MKKRLLIIVIAGIILLSSAVSYFNAPPSGMKDVIFSIHEGETLNKVAGRLREQNLVRHEKFFVMTAYIFGDAKVMTGKYRISGGMTSRRIVQRICEGEILRRKVTIPEGFNIYEIAERLSENGITDAGEFVRLCFDAEFLKTIGITYPSAEGLLFPDTYIFAEDSPPKEIIILMHNKMAAVIKSIDPDKLKKLGFSSYQLVNLAALIEKEAKIPSERGYISAIFQTRLKKRWTLGSCATVLYAVKKFKGRLSYDDLKFQSPFNTYLHQGLPPTPICSPGRESITAALNPAETSYLYFVSRNDGSHYFSKTLKEHNRAVDFYQKGINNGFKDDQRL